MELSTDFWIVCCMNLGQMDGRRAEGRQAEGWMSQECICPEVRMLCKQVYCMDLEV